MKDKFECYLLMGLSFFCFVYCLLVGDFTCAIVSFFVFIVWILIFLGIDNG